MKIVSQNDKELNIEIPIVELGVIEQGIGIINGAYHLDDFDLKIGSSEEIIERVRRRLRREMEENKTRKMIVLLIIKQELQWFIKSLKFAMELAGEEEFQTLTGYTWDEAKKTSSELMNMASEIENN